MIFSDLYGTELTRELGSSDTSTLFTTARRKAAINAAQLEFVKRTECLTRQTSITIVDGTQEYDLDAIANADFGWISPQGPSIAITSGTTVRYLEGDDLEETSVERLNVEEPGWRGSERGHADASSTCGAMAARSTSASIPSRTLRHGHLGAARALRGGPGGSERGRGRAVHGLEQSGQGSLRFWHRALVHFAAYDLEKFRKDINAGAAQLQLFEIESSNTLRR
jgi:hypothetical protein